MSPPCRRHAAPFLGKNVETVLVDMDGTLLDLAFDNFFWLELVPAEYAARSGLSLEEARQRVLTEYERVAGTLAWYSVAHWTRELGLDIRTLKYRHRHLISYLPGARRFLSAVRELGKPVLVVTNAHPDTLEIKRAETRLDLHVDGFFCSHDFAAAKESADFWARLEGARPFDPARTLLVEDSAAVLAAARRHGVAHLVGVSRPDSRRPARVIDSFACVDGVGELVSSGSGSVSTSA